MNSCTRQLCYPWGNFSVISGPHNLESEGSLGPTFVSGSVDVRDPVRLAFALELYRTFLSPLSQPLVKVDIFSTLSRPRRTAHLPVSLGFPRLVIQPPTVSIPLAPPRPPEGPLRRLLTILCIGDRTTTTGCSKAPRGLLLRLPRSGLFARV